MKRCLSLLVLTALTTSCARVDEPADDVLLPRLAPVAAAPGDPRQQALLMGRLVVDQGCIKVGTVTVPWHSEVQLVQKRPPILRDTSTGRTYRIGDQVHVGGGSGDPATVDRGFTELAKRCGPPYFNGYFSK